MDFIKVLISFIVVAIIVSTLTVVASEGYDTPVSEMKNTSLKCEETIDTSGEGSRMVTVKLFLPEDSSINKDNFTVYVNVTYELTGATENYEIDLTNKCCTDEEYNDDGIIVLQDTINLTYDKGNYDISVYYPGSTIFDTSTWSGTFVDENYAPDNSYYDDIGSDNRVVPREEVYIPGRDLIRSNPYNHGN